MDTQTDIESVGPSEARSDDKRPLENGELGVPLAKKARGDGELAASVRKVAEIVLVLATMGKMRGGRKPTQAELEMMAEAKEKLAQVCVEFAPKDVFPRDAFGTVIEDLGLSKLKEQRFGIRPPKMSIAEKLLLAKQKMAKSEEFSHHPANYSSQRLQTNLAGASESRGSTHSVRMFTSDKPIPAPALSKSFQHPSHLVHAPAANSTSLPYQLPTSEVRPVAPGVLPATHPGRDASSSLAFPRVDRTNLRLDARSNGSPYASQNQAISSGDHPSARTTTWSMQPPSASVKAGYDKVPMHVSVKAEGAADANMSRMAAQATMSRPFVTQTTLSNPASTNQHLQGMNSVPAPNSHNDIGKIVQKLLQPQLPEKQTWTPPSRDYMNKALLCQMCKNTINEVDTALVCDACEKGYHIRCLNINSKGIPKGEWHCGKCLALSNGKPLPPKYGRVMRNIGTQKILSQGTSFQPSLDKKVEISNEKVNLQQITPNENSGLQSATGNVNNNNIQPTSSFKIEESRDVQGDKLISQEGKTDDKPSSEACPNNSIRTSEANSVSSSGLSDERSCDRNLAIESRSQPSANSDAVTMSSDHLQAAGNHLNADQTRLPNSNEILPKQSAETNVIVDHLGKSLGGEALLCSSNEVKQEHQEIENANPSEAIAHSVGVREPPRPSLRNTDDIEWVGDIVEVAAEKTYYQSCRINGVVYKVEDHALLPSPSNRHTPAKLQAMWEDSKTSSKWVAVSRCYFPSDLPKGVGRPCSSESNEVYESNQTSAVMAGVIHGPCEVLPPSKFDEESERRARLKTGAIVGLRPLFLCKWIYDESKEVFRDVTC